MPTIAPGMPPRSSFLVAVPSRYVNKTQPTTRRRCRPHRARNAHRVRSWNGHADVAGEDADDDHRDALRSWFHLS